MSLQPCWAAPGGVCVCSEKRGVQPKRAASGDPGCGTARGGVSWKPAAAERGRGPAGGVVDLTDLSPPPTPAPTRAGSAQSACARSPLRPVPFPKTVSSARRTEGPSSRECGVRPGVLGTSSGLRALTGPPWKQGGSGSREETRPLDLLRQPPPPALLAAGPGGRPLRCLNQSPRCRPRRGRLEPSFPA